MRQSSPRDQKKRPQGLDTIQTCLYYPGMKPKERVKSQAKERILETADRLFYREGVRAVGISLKKSERRLNAPAGEVTGAGVAPRTITTSATRATASA